LFGDLLSVKHTVLEHVIVKDNTEILDQDLELEHIYDTFIKAMKS